MRKIDFILEKPAPWRRWALVLKVEEEQVVLMRSWRWQRLHLIRVAGREIVMVQRVGF